MWKPIWPFLVVTLDVFILVVSQELPYIYGTVTPITPFKFVGDSLTLNCTIRPTAEGEDSSILRFKRDSSTNTYVFPKESITILSPESIQLTIHHLTLEDDGDYTCFQTSGKKNKVIDRQRVFVDYRPKRVEFIDCLVYNWQNLTCSWSLGVDFKYPNYVDVILKNGATNCPKEPSMNYRRCPHLLSKTSGGWSNDVYLHANIYSMTVVVQTTKGDEILQSIESPRFRIQTRNYDINSREATTSTGTIEVLANLIPAPVVHFEAIVKNSSCIQLNWKHTSSKRREKSYLGFYEIAGSNQWQTINMSSVHIKDNWMSISSGDIYPYSMSTVVCHLTPYTSYNFNVSVLPYPEGSKGNEIHGHRSEWISVPATTSEDVPGISPPLCQSCYHIERCDSNKRRVRLYWRETPKSLRHGVFQNYSLQFLDRYESVLPNATSTVIDVPDASCKVNLTSFTIVGSSEPSVITIPRGPASGDLTPKRFKVETDANKKLPLTYYLSWNLPSHLPLDANIKKITIAWCSKGEVHYVCKDQINWTHLPKEQTNHSFSPGEAFRGHINIGIAMEAFDGDTTVGNGISWTECIYFRNEKPKTPKNVRISTIQQGLTVEWDKPNCRDDEAFIEKYKVCLCETQDFTTCIAGTVDAREEITDTRVTFKALASNNAYLVNVSAMSLAGYGPSSHPLNATIIPIPSSDSGLAIALIVIIVVISFVLLLTFIIVIKCLVGHKDSIKEKMRTLNSRFLIENTGTHINPAQEMINVEVNIESGSYDGNEYDSLIPNESPESMYSADTDNEPVTSSRSEIVHAHLGGIKSSSGSMAQTNVNIDTDIKMTQFDVSGINKELEFGSHIPNGDCKDFVEPSSTSQITQKPDFKDDTNADCLQETPNGTKIEMKTFPTEIKNSTEASIHEQKQLLNCQTILQDITKITNNHNDDFNTRQINNTIHNNIINSQTFQNHQRQSTLRDEFTSATSNTPIQNKMPVDQISPIPSTVSQEKPAIVQNLPNNGIDSKTNISLSQGKDIVLQKHNESYSPHSTSTSDTPLQHKVNGDTTAPHNEISSPTQTQSLLIHNGKAIVTTYQCAEGQPKSPHTGITSSKQLHSVASNNGKAIVTINQCTFSSICHGTISTIDPQSFINNNEDVDDDSSDSCDVNDNDNSDDYSDDDNHIRRNVYDDNYKHDSDMIDRLSRTSDEDQDSDTSMDCESSSKSEYTNESSRNSDEFVDASTMESSSNIDPYSQITQIKISGSNDSKMPQHSEMASKVPSDFLFQKSKKKQFPEIITDNVLDLPPGTTSVTNLITTEVQTPIESSVHELTILSNGHDVLQESPARTDIHNNNFDISQTNKTRHDNVTNSHKLHQQQPAIQGGITPVDSKSPAAIKNTVQPHSNPEFSSQEIAESHPKSPHSGITSSKQLLSVASNNGKAIVTINQCTFSSICHGTISTIDPQSFINNNEDVDGDISDHRCDDNDNDKSDDDCDGDDHIRRNVYDDNYRDSDMFDRLSRTSDEDPDSDTNMDHESSSKSKFTHENSGNNDGFVNDSTVESNSSIGAYSQVTHTEISGYNDSKMPQHSEMFTKASGKRNGADTYSTIDPQSVISNN